MSENFRVNIRVNIRDLFTSDHLRTFALIVSAHPYCARKSICHVIHRARALSTEMNKYRADGYCYSFDWI